MNLHCKGLKYWVEVRGKRVETNFTSNLWLIFHIFADDISSKDVTIEDVRRKAANHSLLADIQAKKIMDKVREFFKREEVTVLKEIPEENLQEKLERMFWIEEASQSHTTEVATASTATRKESSLNSRRCS